MFDHWPISDVLSLFIEIRSSNNFCYNEHIRQSLIINKHPISFFYPSRSDHSTISLRSTHSTMLHHWRTPNVHFPFIQIRSLNNSSYDKHIRQCFLIDQHPISFFSSSRSANSTIFLKMNTFANVWSLTNIRCPFSFHRDQIIEQFLWTSKHSQKSDYWTTYDVFFSSSRWDHWTNSLSTLTFANV